MVGQVFVSYSTKDKFFAELLEKNFSDNLITVWRDVGSIRAGDEWRNSIDAGIDNCSVLVLALSSASCLSHYVTYEWARAIGLGKPIIPVMLEECARHPKIEPIQYIDFRNHNDSTWQLLVQRIKNTIEQSELKDEPARVPHEHSETDDALQDKIVAYLQDRGFRVISFDRIRQRIDPSQTDEKLDSFVKRSSIFRACTTKDFKAGLRLL